MKNILILLFASVILSSCEKEEPIPFTFISGIQNLEINVDNTNRTYVIYLPENLEENAPLLFVCHGYGGSANGIMNYSKFNHLADENGFAVCYPQGSIDSYNSSFWQIGLSYHVNENVDDVKFLSELAIKLQNEYRINPENTFVTGFSNGGDLCNLLASKASDIFKAAAPVAGTIMKWIADEHSSGNPIPILMINGTNDGVTLWDGDINDNYGFGAYLSAESMRDFWVEHNNCTELIEENLPNLILDDGSSIILEKNINGSNNTEVWFYKVINGSHSWPGHSGNMDIDPSEEIWNFFEHFLVL